MYETIIPVGGIQEEKLRNLAEQLSEISGQKINIELQFVISTGSLELSSMLDDLRDAIKKGEVPAKPQKRIGKTKVKAAKAVKAGKRLITLEDGSVMSSQAFNKQLRAGEFKPGMCVTSSIKGKGNVASDGKSMLWGLG